MNLGLQTVVSCDQGMCGRHLLLFLATVVFGFGLGCSDSQEERLSKVTAARESALDERCLTAAHNAREDSRPVSVEEARLRQRIEEQLEKDRPTHRIRLLDGRVIEGRVVGETPSSVRVREGFGHSGHVTSPYARANIAAVETLPAASFEITRRDLQFYAEFPEFHFAKSPPYTIVTDESYGEVQKIIRLLTDLQQQFKRHFAPLIREGTELRDIHVVFFGSEAPYRAYTKRVASALVNSAGFYSSSDNRLALLSQLGTQRFSQTQSRIEEHRRSLTEHSNRDPAERYQAGRRLVELRSDMTSEAKATTERLIRHEGAHQLFHGYRIHSLYGLEPTWLTEGLAQYCETHEIGRYHAGLARQVAKARDAGRLLPLKTLLNHRDPAGFFSLGGDVTDLAYAQSWAVVSMLMEDEFRGRLFNYIKNYRDIADDCAATSVRKTEPLKLLEKCLQTDYATLEAQWQKFISRI